MSKDFFFLFYKQNKMLATRVTETDTHETLQEHASVRSWSQIYRRRGERGRNRSKMQTRKNCSLGKKKSSHFHFFSHFVPINVENNDSIIQTFSLTRKKSQRMTNFLDLRTAGPKWRQNSRICRKMPILKIRAVGGGGSCSHSSPEFRQCSLLDLHSLK